MKKLLTLAATAALLIGASQTFAQTLDGPVPAGAPGKWTLGAGYQYSNVNYEPIDLLNVTTDPTKAVYGVNQFIGDPIEIRQNRLFVKATYTFGKSWDMGIHIGLGDGNSGSGLQRTYSAFGSVAKFNASYTGFAGLSFHGAFYHGEKFSFGVVGTGSIFTDMDQDQHYTVSAYVFDPTSNSVQLATGEGVSTTRITGFRDGQVALAMGFKAGNSLVYGGPLYYRSSGRVLIDESASVTDPDGNVSTLSVPTARAHIRAHDNAGGYLGIRMPAHSDWMFNMEAAYRGGINLGINFTRAF